MGLFPRPDDAARSVSDAELDATRREHFRTYVRGRARCPALRVGNQPYGLLPVVAPGAWSGDDADRAGDRRRACAGCARSGDRRRPASRHRPRRTPDADLVTLLRMPTALGELPAAPGDRRSRRSRPGRGCEGSAAFQEAHAPGSFLALGGMPADRALVDFTLDRRIGSCPSRSSSAAGPRTRRLLDPNYISRDRRGGRRVRRLPLLLVAPPPRRTRCSRRCCDTAAQLEMAAAADGLVVMFELAGGDLRRARHGEGARARAARHRPPTTWSRPVADGGAVAARQGRRPASSSRRRAVRDDLRQQHARRPPGAAQHAELAAVPRRRALGEFRASLERLAGLPPAELGRLAARRSDCVLAPPRRLDHLAGDPRLDARARDRSPDTHVGGYGWVEDLRPEPTPDSLGYLHAPVDRRTPSTRRDPAQRAPRPPAATTTGHSRSTSARAGSRSRSELLDGVRQGSRSAPCSATASSAALRDRRIDARPLHPRVPPAPRRSRQRRDGLRRRPAGRGDRGARRGRRRRACSSAGARRRRRARRPSACRTAPTATTSRPCSASSTTLLDAVSDLLRRRERAPGRARQRRARRRPRSTRSTARPAARLGVVAHAAHRRSARHRLCSCSHDAAARLGWARDPRARGRAAARRLARRACSATRPGPVRRARSATPRASVPRRSPRRSAELGLSPLSTVLAACSGGAASADRARGAPRRSYLGGAGTAAGAASSSSLADPPAGAARGASGCAELLDLGASVLDLARQLPAGDALDARPRPPSAPTRALDPADADRAAGGAPTRRVAALRRPSTRCRSRRPRRRRASPARAARPLRRRRRARCRARPATSRDALAAQVRARARAPAGALAAVRRGSRPPSIARRPVPASARSRTTSPRIRPCSASASRRCRRSRAGRTPAELAALARDRDRAARRRPARAGDVARTGTPSSAPPPPARRPCSTAAEMLGRRHRRRRTLTVAQLPHRAGRPLVGLPVSATARPPARPRWSCTRRRRPTRPAARRPGRRPVVRRRPEHDETTGVTFHFDAPGARAPQTHPAGGPADRTRPPWTRRDARRHRRRGRRPRADAAPSTSTSSPPSGGSCRAIYLRVQPRAKDARRSNFGAADRARRSRSRTETVRGRAGRLGPQ